MPSTSKFETRVFFNCPSDEEYAPIQEALIFTTIVLGFEPRSSHGLEGSGSQALRVAQQISECRFGVHDLSRVDCDNVGGPLRFDMPFQLGLDMGCHYYGGTSRLAKEHLILYSAPSRFDIFRTTISGYTTEHHHNDPEVAMSAVYRWLSKPDRSPTTDGKPATIDDLIGTYKLFQTNASDFYPDLPLAHERPNFSAFVAIVYNWATYVRPHLRRMRSESLDHSH